MRCRLCFDADTSATGPAFGYHFSFKPILVRNSPARAKRLFTESQRSGFWSDQSGSLLCQNRFNKHRIFALGKAAHVPMSRLFSAGATSDQVPAKWRYTELIMHFGQWAFRAWPQRYWLLLQAGHRAREYEKRRGTKGARALSGNRHYRMVAFPERNARPKKWH